jgi:predicted RNA-binding protein with PUA-like domain
MAYWLVKSEPFKYSWSQMVADGRTHWDGVRNYQAANNLKAMQVGDRAFFYHSNEGKEIVGVVEIARTAYPDPSDETGRFVMVDVKPVEPVPKPVTLVAIKADPRLADFALVRQSRLSVVPVKDGEWAILSAMAGLSAE